MRISDWSSDVCSSDLLVRHLPASAAGQPPRPGDHRRREEVRRTIAVTRFTADRKEFRVQSPKPMSCRPWPAAILVAVSGPASAQETQPDAPDPAVAAPAGVFVPPRDPPLPLSWPEADGSHTGHPLETGRGGGG